MDEETLGVIDNLLAQKSVDLFGARTPTEVQREVNRIHLKSAMALEQLENGQRQAIMKEHSRNLTKI